MMPTSRSFDYFQIILKSPDKKEHMTQNGLLFDVIINVLLLRYWI